MHCVAKQMENIVIALVVSVSGSVIVLVLVVEYISQI